MPNPIINPAASRARRDAGIQLALWHAGEDWRQYAAQIIAELAATGREFTADDFRVRLEWQPEHANAIGGAIRTALQRGVIRKTGQWRNSERVSAHARALPVYVGK